MMEVGEVEVLAADMTPRQIAEILDGSRSVRDHSGSAPMLTNITKRTDGATWFD
jgi:hypothetical protein